MNLKNNIDSIIQDLGDSKPIKNILLKAQIVASQIDNPEFEKWIRFEQNGYPDSDILPDYRILNANLKADISQPYVGIIQNYTIPSGISDSETINDYLDHVKITNTLSEIEDISNNRNGDILSINCRAIAYTEINKHINGNAERVWQEIPASSLINILDVFRSRLLDFFLNLDKELNAGIDFSKIEGQQIITQIVNNNYINSLVTNTGNGSINTGDISGNTSELTITDPQLIEKLQQLISQLIKESQMYNDEDLKSAVDTIAEECQKGNWCKKSLKFAFHAIQGIITGIAANQLTPIVTKALTLLSD